MPEQAYRKGLMDEDLSFSLNRIRIWSRRPRLNSNFML